MRSMPVIPNLGSRVPILPVVCTARAPLSPNLSAYCPVTKRPCAIIPNTLKENESCLSHFHPDELSRYPLKARKSIITGAFACHCWCFARSSIDVSPNVSSVFIVSESASLADWSMRPNNGIPLDFQKLFLLDSQE